MGSGASETVTKIERFRVRGTYKVREKQEETGRSWPRVKNQVPERVGGLNQRQIRKGERSDFPEKRQKKSKVDGTE